MYNFINLDQVYRVKSNLKGNILKMTQHTILKSFFILSISLMILIAGASCDENNNIFDGGGADNGDEPLK